MKNLKYLFLFLVLFSLQSCDKDDADYEFVTVATPELMSKAAFRDAVKIDVPTPIEQSGKIYAYKNFIFVSDVNKGVHVIDNTNPKSPQAIKYIRIPGNEDISVKDDFLYADSATDLLVFDISDINAIVLKERLEDVFDIYDFFVPTDADIINYGNFNFDDEIIVGWTKSVERREKVDDSQIDIVFNDALMSLAPAESVTGQGGSLARFQIVKDYLYTVGSHEMFIFNISNLSQPTFVKSQYSGNNIETLFQAEGYLYLGSTDGMYIYDLVNPAAPEYVSEFVHWTGCDPVVVDGDYAYLTIRGGNNCGEQESVLEVIDVSDKTNPTLAARHTLESPYGLGIKGGMLFVCDGTAGLKLFDKEDPLNLEMIKSYKNIQATDVIPLENTLIMIGGKTLYQYEYGNNDISLVSSFSLN